MSQRMEALAIANGVRSRAARVKREIAALSREDGARRVAELLRDPTPAAGAVKIADLLEAIHRVGPTKARGLLADCEIPPLRRGARVRELTPRERELIAEAVVWMVEPPEPPAFRWPGSRADQHERHRRLIDLLARGVDHAAVAQQLGYAHADSVRKVAAKLEARRTA